MRKQLRKTLLTMVLVSVGTTGIYTNAMTLTYNGEQHHYTGGPITLNVNGNIVETKIMPPVMIENRVMVPVREVFEPLGASIEWKNNEKTVYLNYNDTMMSMEAGNTEVWLNGETVELDIPAMIINDKVMVPVRFISENMDFEVQWDPNEQTVFMKEIIIEEEDDDDDESLEEDDDESLEENASGGGSFGDDLPEVDSEMDDSDEEDEEDESSDEEAEQDGNESDEDNSDNEEQDEDESDNGMSEEEEDTSDDAYGQDNDDLEYEENEEEVPLNHILDGIARYYEGEDARIRNYVIGETLESVYIKDVMAVRSGDDEALGIIEASGAISNVEVLLQDGKLIIDIINSKSALESTIKPSQNDYIENIRTSQFTEDVTRVVFDLKSGIKPIIQLSQDRESIYIYFQPQEFEGFGYGKNKKGEFIVIENMVKAQMEIEGFANDGLMYINIPNTILEDGFIWEDVEGSYIKEIYGVGDKDSNDTQVIIMFKETEQPIRVMETVEGHTVIYFTPPTHDHIRYYGENEDMLVIDKIEGMSADEIKVEDLYREKKIHIDLNGNYGDYIVEGKINTSSDVIENIEVRTDKTTVITIDQKTINAVDITEDEDSIYIRFVAPKEKYEKILILDIGHGGTDPGAIASGIREKDINSKQALAIRDILERETDIKVYMTREDDDTLTLQYRTELANEIEGDIFISVHNNAIPNNTNITGTEVLYCPDTSNTKGRDMAAMMQEALIEAVGTVDRGIKSRPDLYVLRTTTMPAILLEGGFLTNASEAARLNSNDFNQKYARAVADTVVEIFDTMSFR